MTDQKATVGRIVHFYNESLDTSANNGTGIGPYAAIVTQTFPGPYVNLKVLPYGSSWDEGSVSEKVECGPGRYWVWPPRE
jgi:hypothetical protein